MTIGDLLRAPGRTGWLVLALLAFLNHNLYVCGVPVSWATWLISLALSILMAVVSGMVHTAFAFRRWRLRNPTV
jgi:hypothetical protein